MDESKLDQNVRSYLGAEVTIKPYESIFDETRTLSHSISSEASGRDSVKQKFLVSTQTSWALSQSLGGEDMVTEVRSPVGDAKAIKNEVELKGMKACHVRDGAALIEYFSWLENELLIKKTKLDEVQAADKLESIRSYEPLGR